MGKSSFGLLSSIPRRVFQKYYVLVFLPALFANPYNFLAAILNFSKFEIASKMLVY
jgi:hypothetical protein